MTTRFKPQYLALVISLIISACSVAPRYEKPVTATIPSSFKELPDWHTATPSDEVSKGEWWLLFNDPILNELEKKVLVSNQNLAAAKAAYKSAQSMVREQRAALLPTISLNPSATVGDTFKTAPSNNSNSSSSTKNAFSVTIGATWEPDLWGKISSAVDQAKAQTSASAGDLANATLSAQGELALDYVQLRGTEAQQQLIEETIQAYKRSLEITTNRYDAGVVAKSDVLQAETALHNALANAANLERQRAVFEHAIAVLVGENPSNFSLAQAQWNPTVQEVPAVLPATLLERRPDVAAAERRVAAANAAIGIQRAAYYPNIGLTGGVGTSASRLSELFQATTSAWSLGVTGALTLLDFGATDARVEQAQNVYEQSVAQYRQTVLTALQQTEDQLVAIRVLKTVSQETAAAAKSANQAEGIAQNQYKAGVIGYSDVILTQTAALSARTAETQAIVNQQVAAISLIQAIGGNWGEPTEDKTQ